MLLKSNGVQMELGSTSSTKKSSTKEAVQGISQCLFEMEIQMHIAHLQAKDKSYATHMALGAFYEALGDLNDDLVEKSYVKTGTINKYSSMEISNNIEPISLIKKEMTKIEQMREMISEGYIQQMVDNIIETFAHVIYKLENLH